MLDNFLFDPLDDVFNFVECVFSIEMMICKGPQTKMLPVYI